MDKVDEIRVPIFLTFEELDRGYSFWQSSGHLPQELLSMQNQLVQIRGFLYKTELNNRGAWILAAEPNLRSCCVGSSGKRGLQLVVTGDLPREGSITAVSLKGHLQFPGEIQGPFYGLSDVSLQSDITSYGTITLLIIFLISVLAWRYSAK